MRKIRVRPRYLGSGLPQGADFYIVRFGVKPEQFAKIVRSTHDALRPTSLNIGVECSVTVDAVNESGIARGSDRWPATSIPTIKR